MKWRECFWQTHFSAPPPLLVSTESGWQIDAASQGRIIKAHLDGRGCIDGTRPDRWSDAVCDVAVRAVYRKWCRMSGGGRVTAAWHLAVASYDNADDADLIWILWFLEVLRLTSWNVDRWISTDFISWFNYLPLALRSSWSVPLMNGNDMELALITF